MIHSTTFRAVPGFAQGRNVRLSGLDGDRVSRAYLAAVASIGIVPILACSGVRPSGGGGTSVELAPCPPSPNCVSSEATDAAHGVDAFALAASPDEAWRAVQEEVARLPRTAIVEVTPERLHAESVSAWFGFVDDLELRLRAAENRIDVRSASRVGYSDLGVNRRRVETLREALRTRGMVR